jgi:hypothetical protein
MAWIDNAGLYQKYGLEQTVTQAGGEYKTWDAVRMIEFDLDLTTLTTTAGTIIPGTDNIHFPAGVAIEEVQVVNKTAATSGGAATLNLGLVRYDRTTEIDFDGILVTAPIADFNAANERKSYTVGVTGAGALITAGTVGSNPGYLVASYGTAAFTAGLVTIRIMYRKP